MFIDPKHEHTKFGDGHDLDHPKLVTRYDPDVRVMIFQTYYWTPELDSMVDQVFDRQTPGGGARVIVVFDEFGGLASATTVPTGITRLYTQGRAKGVGSWAMLQFVKRNPKVVKSQTEIWFIFRLTSEEDRYDLLEYIGDQNKAIAKKPLKYHWFYVYNDSWDLAILFRPVKVPKSFVRKV